MLYSPYSLIVLAAQLGNDFISENGYPLVLAKELCNLISNDVLKGMMQERNGAESDNAIYNFLKDQSPYALFFVKCALKQFPSFKKLYDQYVDTMGDDQLSQQLFWIIDDYRLTSETMDLIEEKSDINSFLHYFFSKGNLYYDLERIPEKEVLDEESLRLLNIYKYVWPVEDDYDDESDDCEPGDTDELRAKIREAINEIKDPEKDLSSEKSCRDLSTLGYVYLRLNYFENRDDIKGILYELHKAVYERLCTERYPQYLMDLIESKNIEDYSRFSIVIHTVHPEQGIGLLVKWADQLYEKADPNSAWPALMPHWLLAQAASEYEEAGDTDNAIACTERLVFEYDMINSFGKENWDTMTTALNDKLSDHSLPLVYCTQAATGLISRYNRFGYKEKAIQLLKHLDFVAPLIIEYLENNNLDIKQRTWDYYYYIWFARGVDIYKIDESLLEHLRYVQLKEIRSLIETSGVHSDYFKLNEMINKYLQNEICLLSLKNIDERASELIQILENYSESTDMETKSILEDEMNFVREKQEVYKSQIIELTEQNERG